MASRNTLFYAEGCQVDHDQLALNQTSVVNGVASMIMTPVSSFYICFLVDFSAILTLFNYYLDLSESSNYVIHPFSFEGFVLRKLSLHIC